MPELVRCAHCSAPINSAPGATAATCSYCGAPTWVAAAPPTEPSARKLAEPVSVKANDTTLVASRRHQLVKEGRCESGQTANGGRVCADESEASGHSRSLPVTGDATRAHCQQ